MPDKLEERLGRRTGGWKSNISYADNVGHLINPDGPEALAEITRLKGKVERLSAEVAAWGNIASGLRAYLEDRRNEGDHITPEKVLSILESDIHIMEERSRQIYAATQYRSQAAETALAAKQALIDELVEGLKVFANAADPYRGNQDEFEIVLPRGPFFGKDDWSPCFTVGQLRRARSLISKARSSRKAGSDA